MGFFDELFGVSKPPKPASDGLFEGLFGGGSRPATHVPLGGYAEPIMPTGTQARGYGGQMFGSVSDADKSRLMDGVVTDRVTGWTGTPRELYERCVREGRDPRHIVAQFHKW